MHRTMVKQLGVEELAQKIAEAAAEKQGYDISIIDVSDELNITDYFVVISAKNERQISAIVDEIEKQLIPQGYKYIRREGERQSRWVLLDYMSIIVHIQHEQEREFYDLDRLWHDCPRLEWEDLHAFLPRNKGEALGTAGDVSTEV